MPVYESHFTANRSPYRYQCTWVTLQTLVHRDHILQTPVLNGHPTDTSVRELPYSYQCIAVTLQIPVYMGHPTDTSA